MARRKLRVDFTVAAHHDLQSIREWIARDRPVAALRWFRRAKEKIDLMATMPLDFEVIPEASYIGIPLRHILHGDYRIIYIVVENRIKIIRIISGARRLTAALLGIKRGGEGQFEGLE